MSKIEAWLFRGGGTKKNRLTFLNFPSSLGTTAEGVQANIDAFKSLNFLQSEEKIKRLHGSPHRMKRDIATQSDGDLNLTFQDCELVRYRSTELRELGAFAGRSRSGRIGKSKGSIQSHFSEERVGAGNEMGFQGG